MTDIKKIEQEKRKMFWALVMVSITVIVLASVFFTLKYLNQTARTINAKDNEVSEDATVQNLETHNNELVIVHQGQTAAMKNLAATITLMELTTVEGVLESASVRIEFEDDTINSQTVSFTHPGEVVKLPNYTVRLVNVSDIAAQIVVAEILTN